MRLLENEVSSSPYQDWSDLIIHNTFTFQAPLKSVIELNVEYYDIENSTDCIRDWLQILDHAAPNKSKLTPRLCGLYDPQLSRGTAPELNFTSYLHHFHVHFSSDKSNSPAGGFTISYKVLPGMLLL